MLPSAAAILAPPARSPSLASFLSDIHSSLGAHAQTLIDNGVPNNAHELADLTLEAMQDLATDLLQLKPYEHWQSARASSRFG